MDTGLLHKQRAGLQGHDCPLRTVANAASPGLLPTEFAAYRVCVEGELMRRRWEQIKRIYKQEFVQFLDERLLELDQEKQTPSSIPQSH